MTARIVEESTHLDASPDLVWRLVQRPDTFLFVCRPRVSFRPVDLPDWPETWAEGAYRVQMTGPFGLPLGWQIIRISFPPPQGATRFLRDRGEGQITRLWDHLIIVEPEGAGTRYTDRVKIDAGRLTPLAVPLVRDFYRHRQRRLARLVAGQQG